MNEKIEVWPAPSDVAARHASDLRHANDARAIAMLAADVDIIAKHAVRVAMRAAKIAVAHAKSAASIRAAAENNATIAIATAERPARQPGPLRNAAERIQCLPTPATAAQPKP
jgi:hypothetical protein